MIYKSIHKTGSGQIGTGTCDGLEALSLEEVLLLPVLPHQIGSLKQRVK
jgi:hypothetical protein